MELDQVQQKLYLEVRVPRWTLSCLHLPRKASFWDCAVEAICRLEAYEVFLESVNNTSHACPTQPILKPDQCDLGCLPSLKISKDTFDGYRNAMVA